MNDRKENVVKWGVLALIILSVLAVVPLFIFVGILLGLIILATMLLCLGAAMAVHVNMWKKCHYICPSCVTPFKPDFLSSLTAMNYFDQRKMRCPKCGSYQLMRILEDKDSPGRTYYRR